MNKIFKYGREDFYFNGSEELGVEGIGKRLEQLIADPNYGFKKQIIANYVGIMNLTRPAIRINNLHFVKEIHKRISSLVDGKIQVSYYLLRMNNANAHATARMGLTDKNQELVIVLSQHFCDELNFEEQVALIAHEVAHFIFAHTSIPSQAISNKLKYSGNSLEDRLFLDNLQKWSICKEITADLFALQATRSYKATALALIKYTTGVCQGAELILNNLEDQFIKMKTKKVVAILKEHPLTLLRIKVIKAVYEHLNTYGWGNNGNQVQDVIDAEVKMVYPEILLEIDSVKGEVLFESGIAVIAADDEVHPEELVYLTQITHYNQINNKRFQQSKRKAEEELKELMIMKGGERDKFRKSLIKRRLGRSIKLAENLKPMEVSVVVRHLLHIAAADGKVDQCELNLVYDFAKNFEYTKQDVAQQLFNLK